VVVFLYGPGPSVAITAGSALPGMVALCAGRLTLETGVPVSLSDQTAKTTIFWTPFRGDVVVLWSGTAYVAFVLAQLSKSLGTLTSGKNYDVFIQYNGGTPILTFSAAWTNDTTRADAISYLNGAWFKTSDLTQRWVGTFRTTSTTTTEDSLAKRFVYNRHNQVPRKLFRSDGTDHSYDGNYRQFNADAANKVELVLGDAAIAHASVFGEVDPSADAVYASIGGGEDSTTSAGGLFPYAATQQVAGIFGALPMAMATGYHFIAILEATFATGSSTFLYGHVAAVVEM
jgi:hypothetical protein